MMAGAGAALGMVSDIMTTEMNANNNRKAQNKQYRLNERMAQNNQQRAYDMLEYTRPLKQVGWLKEAGLNPAMMYGGGGGGGQTASGAGSGSGVGMASTQVSQSGTVAGINNLAQLQLTNAQKENIEANTNKTNVETAKLGGEDTDKVRAETENASLRNEYQKILNNVQGMSQEEQIEAIKALSRKGVAEATTAGNEAHVSTNTYNKEIEAKNAESDFTTKSLQDRLIYVKHDAVGKALENALTQAKTRYSNAEIAEIAPRIRKMQAEVSQGWERLNQSERELKIRQFAEELKAEYPSVGQSIGKNINEILRYLEEKSGTQSGSKTVDEPRW